MSSSTNPKKEDSNDDGTAENYMRRKRRKCTMRNEEVVESEENENDQQVDTKKSHNPRDRVAKRRMKCTISSLTRVGTLRTSTRLKANSSVKAERLELHLTHLQQGKCKVNDDVSKEEGNDSSDSDCSTNTSLATLTLEQKNNMMCQFKWCGIDLSHFTYMNLIEIGYFFYNRNADHPFQSFFDNWFQPNELHVCMSSYLWLNYCTINSCLDFVRCALDVYSRSLNNQAFFIERIELGKHNYLFNTKIGRQLHWIIDDVLKNDHLTIWKRKLVKQSQKMAAQTLQHSNTRYLLEKEENDNYGKTFSAVFADILVNWNEDADKFRQSPDFDMKSIEHIGQPKVESSRLTGRLTRLITSIRSTHRKNFGDDNFWKQVFSSVKKYFSNLKNKNHRMEYLSRWYSMLIFCDIVPNKYIGLITKCLNIFSKLIYIRLKLIDLTPELLVTNTQLLLLGTIMCHLTYYFIKKLEDGNKLEELLRFFCLPFSYVSDHCYKNSFDYLTERKIQRNDLFDKFLDGANGMTNNCFFSSASLDGYFEGNTDNIFYDVSQLEKEESERKHAKNISKLKYCSRKEPLPQLSKLLEENGDKSIDYLRILHNLQVREPVVFFPIADDNIYDDKYVDRVFDFISENPVSKILKKRDK
ncbi:hypothetical protein SNEBB_001532 [Seison nebaliae]|nr:hypothetical protein SNEBB_001532 [Seison nebaliae]